MVTEYSDIHLPAVQLTLMMKIRARADKCPRHLFDISHSGCCPGADTRHEDKQKQAKRRSEKAAAACTMSHLRSQHVSVHGNKLTN